MIQLENKLFLRTPRTASTSVSQAMLDKGGIQVANPHCRRNDVCLESKPEVFTVIRNPLDVLVSWFILNPSWRDFGRFIREYDHCDMTDMGLLFYHVPHCDRVFIYERLDEVEKYLGVKLSILNTTEGKFPYRKYWNDYRIQEAKKRFATDFEIYRKVSDGKITTTLEW